MVPNLVTALTGSISELEARMLESMPAIERWFRLEWMEHTPPFYTSADLRNAGYKLAPVDISLFPTSFDTLTAEMLPLAVQAAMAAIEKICPEAKNLLLIPDTNRSDAYLKNVQCLVAVLHHAGLNVRLGALSASDEAQTLTLPDGEELPLEPLVRHRGRLGLKQFDPCTILLNTDLTAGVPPLLHNLHEQYLLPPLHAGWPSRRKSRHFQSYEEVAKKFAKLLGMDPWLINPLHGHCGKVDFATAEGIDCIKTHTDALLTKVRRKYKEYGIGDKPFVVVKADNARGDGILTLRDARELDDPERVARSCGVLRDGGRAPTEVLVQEGVVTCERIDDAAAEPVVMMIDRYVIGGFYRVHDERGVDENLAAPGSRTVPLAFAGGVQLPRPGAKALSSAASAKSGAAAAKSGPSAPNRFYMHGVIGRLAMLAASYELEATDPDAESYD